MSSKAISAFDENLKDIEALLKLHAEKGGDAKGRRYGLEVLNKSAVVLITSFWEAYCEDIAEEAIEYIVTYAKNAEALPMEIKKIIAKKLKADSHELAIWCIADDKWRAVLRMHLADIKGGRNKKLNTPKCANIDDLFESTIGLPKISSNWSWAKLSVAKAAAKLDKFVELRGAIAHRGKAQTSVKKAQVVDYLDFVKHAATKTRRAVDAHVRKITDQSLF